MNLDNFGDGVLDPNEVWQFSEEPGVDDVGVEGDKGVDPNVGSPR